MFETISPIVKNTPPLYSSKLIAHFKVLHFFFVRLFGSLFISK
jgi:hypothetical protein